MSDTVIRPQPGAQEKFMASSADIVIYGGAAGSGKTFNLLMDPIRYIDNPKFGGVIFRQNSNQITNEGGLWDTSMELYGLIQGAFPRITPNRKWVFPSGAEVGFGYLERDPDVLKYQGSQICFLGFDELTHFCLHPDTEVLTEFGWKNIRNVKPGERVPSLSPKGKIQLKKVTETPSYSYHGKLVEVFQKQGISMSATPNHRIPVLSQSKQPDKDVYRFVRVDKLTERIEAVARTGAWDDGNEVEQFSMEAPTGRGIGGNANVAGMVNMDDWLEFLGWYFSEGSSYLSAKSSGGTSPCISIRQTKESPSLHRLMARLPWRCRPDGSGGYKIYSRQLYDVLKPMGDQSQRRVPRYVFSLSKRQQSIFFDAFVAGDGHITKTGGIQIGLCNEGLIDDLHEMCVYLGRNATKASIVTKTGFRVYSLSVWKPKNCPFTQVKPKDTRLVDFDGNVHCLTVEDNHTFMVRHNGRTHWTGNSKYQFFYMLSRNRSMCGVKPYVRATCNPDADSWVAEFIAWWIDQDTGYPIKERSGKIRWMVRVNDEIYWAGTKKEGIALAIEKGIKPDKAEILPKSVTFISATLYDNQALLEKNPDYEANLLALGEVERERLLMGNWKIKPQAGLYFKRSQVQIIQTVSNDIQAYCRGWDLAATTEDENGDAAYTAGVLMARRANGTLIVLDVINQRLSAGDVRNAILNTARADAAAYGYVRTRLPQDPGQAGKAQAFDMIKMLQGYDAVARPESGSKENRAAPVAAQWQHGNIDILAGPWNDMYFSQLESFPDSKFKDMVDATSSAFNELTQFMSFNIANLL